MKRLSMILSMVLVASVMFAQGIAFEPEGTLLPQAAAKAKKENKLVFVDCYTQWCGPCKKMARDIFPDAKVGEYMNAKFVNLKIDMEAAYAQGLSKEWQVSGYPTFIIFNADGKEIGRFMGGSDADKFISRVEEKSKIDAEAGSLEARWNSGDRDEAFLKEYLASLTATYKRDDADMVAETLLMNKEENFASDPELAAIFMKHINNPYALSFIYTAQNPAALKAAVGDRAVDMKINNVLSNYTNQLFVKKGDKVALDEDQFAAFQALLRRIKSDDADHYRLTVLITDAEKAGDLLTYVSLIEEYLATPGLEAPDMTLANWAKPFSAPGVNEDAKKRMIAVLRSRVAEIEAGNRQPQTQLGNMRLSRPTDELLRMIIQVMETGQVPMN
ncbi:MAG: thioredoxin family protein [Bacteroidaceae bacterium]|nr:thioredoxin family protein [Bacteroidaceae bacterium]